MKRYSTDIREWLAEALADYGRGGRARLAEALGKEPSVVTRVLNTDPTKETRDLSAEEFEKAANFLGSRPGSPRNGKRRPDLRPLVSSFDPDPEHRGTVFEGGRGGIPEGEIPQVEARLGLGHAEDAPTIQIPVGDHGISAVPVVDTWKIPKNVLQRRLRGAVSSLHIVECEGDSMDPRIRDGDFVFIDTSRRVPSPPGIFALNDGYGQTLKRIEIIPNTDPPRVKVIPENKSHTSYEMLLEEVRIIGRYVCRLTMD